MGRQSPITTITFYTDTRNRSYYTIHIYLSYYMVTIFRDIDITGIIGGNSKGTEEPRSSCHASIPAVPFNTRTCKSCNDALRIDLPDDMVSQVCYIYITCRVKSDICR